MLKHTLVLSLATVGLLLTAQASAYQKNGASFVVSIHSGHHSSSQSASKKRFHQKAAHIINQEQYTQARMIKKGIRSCKITPREAATLKSQQLKISKMERRLSRQGLSKWELAKLKSLLQGAKVKINTLMYNHSTCGTARKSQRHHRGYKQYSGRYSVGQR